MGNFCKITLLWEIIKQQFQFFFAEILDPTNPIDKRLNAPLPNDFQQEWDLNINQCVFVVRIQL